MQYLFCTLLPLVMLMALSGCNSADNNSALDSASSKIVYLDNVPSRYVQARNVEVWLPRQYFQNPSQHFPVLYMHDGQNLFNASSSNFGVAWEVDDTAQRLIDAGKIKPFIIVGIWSTAKRGPEYFPEKAATYFANDAKALAALQQAAKKSDGPEYLADEYLQFLVKELKPKIDASYRTLPDKANTSISGSSMGGLISIYALAEYPDVFGGAACLSTHWPILGNNDNKALPESIRQYLTDHLPKAGEHFIYYDFGTETLDQYYEVHQVKVDAIMRAKGYVEGRDWVTKKFPGAAHSEIFWQQRMDGVLEFLLNQ